MHKLTQSMYFELASRLFPKSIMQVLNGYISNFMEAQQHFILLHLESTTVSLFCPLYVSSSTY